MSWLLGLLGVVDCYTIENTMQSEPDYSETQWRTFYGEKPVDYRPEYWTTYYGEEDDPNCQDSRKFYATDGSVVIKKIYREFVAKESNDGKKYTIKYPYNFKLDNCMYTSQRGQLYIEEKSNNPLLSKDKYMDKTENYRRAIVRGGMSGIFTLISDELSNETSNTLTYLNKLDYNIFCHKIDKEDIFDKIPTVKLLMCSSASIENEIKKFLAYNEYTTYTTSFWKSNPNISINFKVSSKTYCNENKYCHKKIARIQKK
ncbi:hypothetical protein [Aggregatibacter actinomycetemcomitans]|uniref:hypothetical protein n=1 Tax=Aggregatibacter actinomycetemcomitans TaxID=714 RepID=UPI00197CA2AF|nr:hypothetical protein [Aggregatibacter actinomycetemcomitans]MBN6062868.1 hypothetical protein [Aggregatibacter actinomycetemcomitans]MBN6082066.1 hypothetical protein [Aggregatibacter actinomycetemcomitans]MBN6082820.1 hypothetical protein [Aggregatibacter actinomycetemcomitans]